jgi:hypothetical protein
LDKIPPQRQAVPGKQWIRERSEARKLLKKRLGEISLGRFIGPAAERVTVRELAQDYLNSLKLLRKIGR